MNLRQKAKKYKRLYEYLLKSPVKYTVEKRNIVTWECSKFYPWTSEVQLLDNEYFDEIIAKDVAHDISQEIANNLDRYVDYTMEYVPHLNAYCFRGNIRIVSNERRLYYESI